jgi:tetratricopeptide (TPR) repeat protein
MSTLAPLHVYIAYQEHMLYLTTEQGDLSAGRKERDGATDSGALAKLNVRELVEGAANSIKSGDVGHARALLDQAVALALDDPLPLLSRLQFRISQHDDAGAKADLDRFGSMALHTAADYDARSTFYREAGQFDRALQDANAAVQLSPTLPMVLKNRCLLQAVMGRLDAALTDCNAALGLAPKFADALEGRGLVHLKAGRLDAAIADYDAALALSPKSASSLYGRGLAKRKKGDLVPAASDLAGARQLDPDIATNFGR